LFLKFPFICKILENNMIIEKIDHQVIIDSNTQPNSILQNNVDLVNEKIQSNKKILLLNVLIKST